MFTSVFHTVMYMSITQGSYKNADWLRFGEGPMILHFNMLSENAGAAGFLDNSSSIGKVHQFQPGRKMSCADVHNLSTISAQLEAKDLGYRDAWGMRGDWILHHWLEELCCLTYEGLWVKPEVTLCCVTPGVSGFTCYCSMVYSNTPSYQLPFLSLSLTYDFELT